MGKINILLSFKLDQVRIMLNNKGFTLIETLLAFQIYLCVVILIGTLSYNLYAHNVKLNKAYNDIHSKEDVLLEYQEISEVIDMVLH